MKIVHISIYPHKDKKDLKSGGVASYEYNLVNNIPYEKNDEVFVLCEKIDNKYEEYQDKGIKVIRCFNRSPRYFIQLYRVITKINPDVIHIQQELALYGNIITSCLLQFLILLIRRNYRTVVTLHGVISIKAINKDFIKENYAKYPVILVKLGFYFIYKPICLFVAKIIVHEKCFKDILIEEYGVKKDKIEVIHHGVPDLKAMDKGLACGKLDLDSSKNIVLFMGYLTGYKGLELLIEGFSDYSKLNSNAFLIIGAGKHPRLANDIDYLEEYSRLESKAKALIPENMYRWVGFIPDDLVTTYYSAADVSVYPYTIQMSSSGPMAIAIGHEKPFLASIVFNSFIENNEILFERDKLSLENSLDRFFKNKEAFIQYVIKMKGERSYKSVGRQTYNLYMQSTRGAKRTQTL